MNVLVFLPNRGTMSRLVITMPARVPLLFVIKVVFFCSSTAYMVQDTLGPNSIKKVLLGEGKAMKHIALGEGIDNKHFWYERYNW